MRKGSFNTEIIDYDEHKMWFAAKIKDKRVKMYIAEIENGQKIGQVRFDEDTDNRWQINVNLNPQFFSKGFGGKVIKSATDYFFREESDVCEIVAKIKEGNVASLKAFAKAGFVCGVRPEKNKDDINIFTYKREQYEL